MANTGYINIRQIARTNKYVVHEVARVKDQRCFAKKELLPQHEYLEVDRFRNEVRLLARLDHPNIIRVTDQQLNDTPLFVITPLYKQNLREWLRTQVLSESQLETDIEDVFTRILDAVAYAHEQGVIHRDLKPENILLNSARDLVVIDFNISISSDSENQRLTLPGEALGTRLYISPEQLRDASSVDERTDIFSLGIILYELHGGRVGSSTLDLRNLPKIARRLVEGCTHVDRTKRFSTVRELIRTWRLACDLNTKQSEINEIESFMLAENNISTNDAERISELFEAYADDEDMVNKFFMTADEQAFVALEIHDVSCIERLTQQWTNFFSETSWPFSYTDDIAKRCEFLWAWIGSASARAQLIIALIILGNRHNRYFVWKVAARLIEASKTKETIEQLASRMIMLDKDDLTSVRDYLSMPKIASKLRPIFKSGVGVSVEFN